MLKINKLTSLETLKLLHKLQKEEIREPKIKIKNEFHHYNTRYLDHLHLENINNKTIGTKRLLFQGAQKYKLIKQTKELECKKFKRGRKYQE